MFRFIVLKVSVHECIPLLQACGEAVHHDRVIWKSKAINLMDKTRKNKKGIDWVLLLL